MLNDILKLREEFKDPHHLISTSDGIILFLRVWEPSKHSNIAIVIFHGITAYSGPYQMFGEALSQIGYTVYGLDLRGHGLSDGFRGDYPSKERFIEDIGETLTFLTKRHDQLIIMGHSLGVLSAIMISNFYLDQINGLILLSAARTVRPGVYAKMSTPTKLKILFSSILKPSKPVISYYRDGIMGLDDPLFNFKYTLRFMKIFSPEKVAFPEKLNIPVVLGIGEHDELFTIEAAQAFFEEIPSDDKKFIIMPGAKHAELPEESWKELIDWLISKFKLGQ